MNNSYSNGWNQLKLTLRLMSLLYRHYLILLS